MKNLTSPKFRHTFDLSNKCDLQLMRWGIIRLSPGQWVTVDGGVTKGRFVRMDRAGNPWVCWNPRQFKLACKVWLAA